MNPFFKKTILILTLAGIVFLGGGVGVARAGDTPPVQQPATINGGQGTYDNIGSIGTGAETGKPLDIIACGGWFNAALSPSCWVSVVTYRLYQVISLVLVLSGYLFDFMLALSIDKAYLDQGFVYEIWAIMRDVSNMMFIFILLFAGIRTMLLGDDWKKPVMMVVVIALLINFSLFFTKIVIDAGNVLAVGVYSSMGTPKTTGSHKTGGEPEHNISETIVKAFAPEKFLKLSSETRDLAPTVFIIAGVISGVAAWIFFKVAFLFMGRLLAFWFLMMWSPIAFIMFASPQLAKQAKFSFDDWLQMLINQAFVAPVFLFMIYIIMTFIEKGKLLESLTSPTGTGVGGFFFDNIFIPIVTAAMVIYALKKSIGVAEGMAGWFGKLGADIGNKVFGLAAGGAGMALTGGVGAVAGAALRSKTLEGMTKSDNWAMKRLGGRAEQVLKGAHETPMDFRNISIGGKKVGEHLGIDSFGLKKGYKESREEETKRLAGTGQASSDARVAAQTTRKDAEKTAEEGRTKAEEGAVEAKTKREVSRVAAQTPGGRGAKASRDAERADASSPQGVATAANRAGDYEARKEAVRIKRKASVDTTIQAQPPIGTPGTPGYTPGIPGKKSLNEELAEMRNKHQQLQSENMVIVPGGPTITLPSGIDIGDDTLKFIADQKEVELETAREILKQHPLSSAAIRDLTDAKKAKNIADKKLKDLKEGADNIEKQEKKIEEYKAL